MRAWWPTHPELVITNALELGATMLAVVAAFAGTPALPKLSPRRAPHRPTN